MKRGFKSVLIALTVYGGIDYILYHFFEYKLGIAYYYGNITYLAYMLGIKENIINDWEA